jgi:hypothetical protein
MSNYTIKMGEAGIVTDQFGGVIRIEKGPQGYATKGFFETVKYFITAVQVEEMASDVHKVTITDSTGHDYLVDSVDPSPYEGCTYPALFATTKDASVYMDIEAMWHLDTTSANWKDGLKVLYTNFPDQGTVKDTIINMVRDYARKYAQEYTTNEICYTNGIAYSNGVTPFVQAKMDELSTLGNSVILDKIFVRRTTAPESIQITYNQVLEATKKAEAVMITANATRDAAITIAQGQANSISLVVNASKQAIIELQSSNMTQSEIIQYLELQYQFDALKKIYENNPNANITLFINAPDTTYTVPIKP